MGARLDGCVDGSLRLHVSLAVCFPKSRERRRERFDRESAGSQPDCRIVVTQRGLVAEVPRPESTFGGIDRSDERVRRVSMRGVAAAIEARILYGLERGRASMAIRRQASRRGARWLSPSPHVSSPGAVGERPFVLDDEQATVRGNGTRDERAECATRDVRGR